MEYDTTWIAGLDEADRSDEIIREAEEDLESKVSKLLTGIRDLEERVRHLEEYFL